MNQLFTRRRSMFSECQHRMSCFVGGPVVVRELSSRLRKSWLGSIGRSGRAGIDRCPTLHPVSDPCEREPEERGYLLRSGNFRRKKQKIRKWCLNKKCRCFENYWFLSWWSLPKLLLLSTIDPYFLKPLLPTFIIRNWWKSKCQSIFNKLLMFLSPQLFLDVY
jgi:hypothetical protein